MSLKNIIDENVELDGITGTTTSDSISMDGVESLSIQAVIDVNTPAAATFTAAVTDICTSTAHGFYTGLKGRGTTTTTLPAGLALATDYFVIVLTADTYKLASSLANALAGTAVDITGTGTGTHTFTPTALAGGSVKLQKSNDATNWSDEGSATNITADAVVWLEKANPGFKWARIYFTLTAGSMSTDNYVVTKGRV